ncbi:hypothetical protein Dimus_033111 [Dionaea muscipula]
MPPGAKKRKAAKKMMQKEKTHNRTSANTTGSRSHENDEVKSFEERDTDGAEVVREEEDEKKAVIDEGDVEEETREVGLQEETVVHTILEKMENAIETTLEEVKAEIASVAEVNHDDRPLKGSLAADPATENGIPVELSVDDDEVAVGKEEVVVEEEKELSSLQEVNGVPPGASIEDVLDLIEERIVDDKPANMQVVPPPEEVSSITESTPAETSEIVDVVESELKENGNEVPPESPSVKGEVQSVPKDSPPEEIETKVTPIVVEDVLNSSSVVELSESTNGDKFPESSSTDISAVVDDVKVLETYEQFENKVVAPVVDTSNGVDVVEGLKTQELSEVRVDAADVGPSPEADSAADLKIQEYLKEQTGATTTSREVDDVKNLELPDNSESQPLVSSAPQAVRRNSWKNCCGLFELFVKDDR